MNWILFGFKGCGKTYFGKLLAKELQRSFIDTDHEIEKAEGLTIREIVQEKERPIFGRLKKKIIDQLDVKKHVIALGGRTILDQQNYNKLQQMGQLVYLRCPKSIIKKRLLIQPLPTFLDPNDPENSFEQMYRSRIKKYEKIPSLQVDLEGKTNAEFVELFKTKVELCAHS